VARIDVTAEHAAPVTSKFTAVAIFTMGGAIGRVAEHETAYQTALRCG
jgi:hypothetical protein